MAMYQGVQTDETGTSDAAAFRNETFVTEAAQISKPAWPNPTIVVGLPKAGTQSIADYFTCGCYHVSHYTACNPERTRGPQYLCGKMIQNNVLAGVDPLWNTGDADVYAQLDVTFNEGICFYPQMDALEEIHKYHPNSTFILNTRNVTHWLHSVDNWTDMRQRFIKCNLTDLPAGTGRQDEDMIRFFYRQVDRIREFCKRHPSHALVEIDVESNVTGAILEKAFEIPADCWGKNDHHGSARGSRRKSVCSR